MTHDDQPSAELTVLIYSSSSEVRQQVMQALGRRPASDLPPITCVEAATAPAVMALVDAGGVDVAIFDAESQPAGGLGVCVTVKEEVYNAPPILALVARADDAWLASWSRADAVVTRPLDALELARATAELLRARVVGSTVVSPA